MTTQTYTTRTERFPSRATVTVRTPAGQVQATGATVWDALAELVERQVTAAKAMQATKQQETVRWVRT